MGNCGSSPTQELHIPDEVSPETNTVVQWLSASFAYNKLKFTITKARNKTMITPNNFYMAITKKHQGADSAPQKTERTSNDRQLFAALRMFLHL